MLDHHLLFSEQLIWYCLGYVDLCVALQAPVDFRSPGLAGMGRWCSFCSRNARAGLGAGNSIWGWWILRGVESFKLIIYLKINRY